MLLGDFINWNHDPCEWKSLTRSSLGALTLNVRECSGMEITQSGPEDVMVWIPVFQWIPSI